MGESNSKVDDSKERAGTFFHDVKTHELNPGDHVYCYPNHKPKKRHGIYIEENKVIYFANAEDGSTEVARVCSCSLYDFTEGCKVRLAAYDTSKVATVIKLSGTTYSVECNPADRVIKVAKFYLRYPSRWLSYELNDNFSEGFAYFCKTGTYKDGGKMRTCTYYDRSNTKTPHYYDIDYISDGSKEKDLPPPKVGDDDSKTRTGKLFHDVESWELKPGDHIYCYRLGGVYTHHGIYIGEKGREVIHFSNAEHKNKWTARVCSCTLEEFVEDKRLRLVAYDVSLTGKILKRNETAHMRVSKPAHEVIETAKYYCKNPGRWGDYYMPNNNCESFATFCKTGKRICSQLSRYSSPHFGYLF